MQAMARPVSEFAYSEQGKGEWNVFFGGRGHLEEDGRRKREILRPWA